MSKHRQRRVKISKEMVHNLETQNIRLKREINYLNLCMRSMKEYICNTSSVCDGSDHTDTQSNFKDYALNTPTPEEVNNPIRLYKKQLEIENIETNLDYIIRF